MKKAKIVLTSIAVLAIVGGTFAYKAAKNLTTIYICSNQSIPSLGTCAVSHVEAISLTPEIGFSLVLGTTAEIIPGSSCTSSLTPCTATLYTITVDED